MSKKVKIEIRVTEEQKKEYQALAEQYQLTLSELIRLLLQNTKEEKENAKSIEFNR